MKIIDSKSLNIIQGLPPLSTKGDKISFDSEFFNMQKSRLHRPHGELAFLGCTFDGITVYYITEKDEVEEFFHRIDAGVWIGHNLKFDITQLRRFAHIPQRKKLWDTMLIEQIMWSGYYDSFSLADVARRRLDIYLEKDVRATFSDNDALSLSQSQIEYSCTDVVATWQVYQHQRAEIDENDLEIWKEIELPFLWTILSMSGVKMNVEKWMILANKNRDCAKEIQDKYGHWENVEEEIDAHVIGIDDENDVGIFVPYKKLKKSKLIGINLNSPKQVKERLQFFGYKMKSTDAEALEKIKDDSEFAKDMLAYRTYAKRASTYGEKFIKDYVEKDGRVYADIHQVGAQTSRTSCRNPNLQNQPHDFEYRDCFIAGEGYVVVVADWGSQEPRCAGYLSQDDRLIEILNSDKKLYIEIARDVLGINITKTSPEYSHIKSTVLGIFYGMSAQGLAKHIGVSEEDAAEMIKKILNTYPGIKEYINRQYKAGDYVQSIYGRKIWLNKYSKGWERGALNYPIQGSAADAMKIAAYRFVDAWKEYGDYHNQYPLRLLVHDEIVCEVEEESAEAMKNILEKTMIDVAEEMHDGIKGSVEIFSGDSWGCKS